VARLQIIDQIPRNKEKKRGNGHAGGGGGVTYWKRPPEGRRAAML
jgi:hypothetical protein